jgi:hypothetical protein
MSEEFSLDLAEDGSLSAITSIVALLSAGMREGNDDVMSAQKFSVSPNFEIVDAQSRLLFFFSIPIYKKD